MSELVAVLSMYIYNEEDVLSMYIVNEEDVFWALTILMRKRKYDKHNFFNNCATYVPAPIVIMPEDPQATKTSRNLIIDKNPAQDDIIVVDSSSDEATMITTM